MKIDSQTVFEVKIDSQTVFELKITSQTVFDKNIRSDYNLRDFFSREAIFMVNFSDRCSEFIKNNNVSSIVRIFFYIAFNQDTNGENVTSGFKCSRNFLCDELKLRKSTVWAALKYLEDELLVNEAIINGQTEFMVNPYFVMVGDDRDKRIAEWARRVNLDNEKRRSKHISQ